jgi:phytoene dehydrogenase-like protein
MLVVYAGLNIDLQSVLNNSANILYFSNYNIDDAMFDIKKIFEKDDLRYLMLSFPSLHDPDQSDNYRSSVGCYIFANYESPDFWLNNRDRIAELVVDLASKIIPNLRNSIEEKFVATPLTFEKFTLNTNGACLGWLPDFERTKLYKIKQRCSINGLYAAGHWYTGEFVPSGGVPVVSFSGRRAAKIIIEDLGKRWNYKEIGL